MPHFPRMKTAAELGSRCPLAPGFKPAHVPFAAAASAAVQARARQQRQAAQAPQAAEGAELREALAHRHAAERPRCKVNAVKHESSDVSQVMEMVMSF